MNFVWKLKKLVIRKEKKHNKEAFAETENQNLNVEKQNVNIKKAKS